MSATVPTGLQRWANDARYVIRGQLGAGATGTVLDAVHGLMERAVAIKVIPKPSTEGTQESEELKRFRREARAQARLFHPAIAQIYDYGEDEKHAWIVMERIDGGSLREKLERDGAMTAVQATAMITSVLDALALAHSEGLVHRDIKPANIMLTSAGKVKLVDFGVAWTTGSDLTQTGMLVGTPAYMPPEVYRGEPADARADLWAVGVVLYQLLTGTRPFSGDLATMMRQILEVEPAPPSVLCRTGMPGLDEVVKRALAKRPADRWQEAGQFAAALRTAVVAAGLQTPGPAKPLLGSPAGGSAGDDTIKISQAGRANQIARPTGRNWIRMGWVLGGGSFVLLLGLLALFTWPRFEGSTDPMSGEPRRSDWVPTQTAGCSVWAKEMVTGQTAHWSGACVQGKGSGPGTLEYAVPGNWGEASYNYNFTGTLEHGKAADLGRLRKDTRIAMSQTTYEGGFRDGEFDGDGTFREQQYSARDPGYRLTGSFKSGTLISGTYRRGPTECGFVGSFIADTNKVWTYPNTANPIGTGRRFWANGNVLEANWVGAHFPDGRTTTVANGPGILVTPTGERYPVIVQSNNFNFRGENLSASIDTCNER